MLPYLNSRATQLNQEFAFFPTAPPHAQGGLFELRTYQLMPGALLEWENVWYVVRKNRVQVYSQGPAYLGEEELKPVGNSLRLSVLGSRKLGDFIRSTICGNTRMFEIIFRHHHSSNCSTGACMSAKKSVSKLGR